MDMRLALQTRAHASLLKQIEADAALLARMGVMDYSLLLGVHYPNWGETAWYPPAGAHTVSTLAQASPLLIQAPQFWQRWLHLKLLQNAKAM